MKKILLFMLLLGSASAWAQCIISGPRSFNVGDTVTFTVTNAPAQCTQCYDWDVTGNASIVGSDSGSSVQITGTGVGSITITLTYFDEAGAHTCSTTRNVTAPPPPPLEITCIGINDAGNGNVTTWVTTNPPLPSPPTGYVFEWKITTQGTSTYHYGFPNVTVSRNCPYGIDYDLRIYDTNNNLIAAATFNCDDLEACPGSGLYGRNAVYPNPVKNIVNIKDDNITHIEIYDLNGIKVKDFKSVNDKKVNVESLKKGNYFVKLYDSNNSLIETSQIVKE